MVPRPLNYPDLLSKVKTAYGTPLDMFYTTNEKNSNVSLKKQPLFLVYKAMFKNTNQIWIQLSGSNLKVGKFSEGIQSQFICLTEILICLTIHQFDCLKGILRRQCFTVKFFSWSMLFPSVFNELCL